MRLEERRGARGWREWAWVLHLLPLVADGGFGEPCFSSPPPSVELHLCGGEGPLWCGGRGGRGGGGGGEGEREERDATELVSLVELWGAGRRCRGGTSGGGPRGGGCIVNLAEREGEGYC